MRDKRNVDDLSIEELEIILAIKKRDARQARLRRLSQQGRLVGSSPEDNRQPITPPRLHEIITEAPPRVQEEGAPLKFKSSRPVRSLAERRKQAQKRQRRDRVLLFVEVAALAAFLMLVGVAFLYVSQVVAATNSELMDQTAALPTPTITPEIDLAIVLPGGHTPPNSPGGARPNLQEIPEHLRPVVQSRLNTPATAPTPSAVSPVNVRIPTLGINHPVVMGDDWEELKRGIGHRLGSANPGARGNMILSAHNDTYGEIFRHLDQLEAGDEVFVATMAREYRYVVRESQIVSPTDVWVMASTQNPTLTLISCYPYMVNTHRIVVFADLVE